MRKLIPLAVALLIGLSACGGNDGGTATADSTANTVAATKAGTATTKATSATTSKSSSDSMALTEDTASDSSLDTSSASAMLSSVLGLDDKAAACLSKTLTSVVGKDDLGAMQDISSDQAKKLADGFVGCGFMKQLFAAAAKESGVTLSDKTLSCVADAAAKNQDLRDDLATNFLGASPDTATSDTATSDTTAADAAMKKIAKDCGISDADLAKLDAN